VGALEIAENDAVTSLDGLGALRVVHGDAEIRENVALATLDALDKLATVEGTLRIGSAQHAVMDGDVLKDVTPTTSNRALKTAWLPALAKVGALEVLRNEALERLEVPLLAEVTTGDLDVSWNPKLTDLTKSFPLVHWVAANVTFGRLPQVVKPKTAPGQPAGTPVMIPAFGNEALTDVSLPALTSVGATFMVGAHPTLAHVSAPQLASADTIDVRECPRLERLELSSLASVGHFAHGGGMLALEHLPRLDLYLPSLVHVSWFLYLRGLDQLTDFHGFAALSLVGDRIEVDENANLTSLNGLERVAALRSLLVFANPKLTTLSGLDGLATVADSLEVYLNALTVASLPALHQAGSIDVEQEGALTEIDLPLLDTVKDVTFDVGSTARVGTASFAALTHVQGALSIKDTFTSLAPFSGLTRVDGDLHVHSALVSAADVSAFVAQIQSHGGVGGAVDAAGQ
jgi:hypothetical protein